MIASTPQIQQHSVANAGSLDTPHKPARWQIQVVPSAVYLMLAQLIAVSTEHVRRKAIERLFLAAVMRYHSSALTVEDHILPLI